MEIRIPKLGMEMTEATPVSYTHLDVYKRQHFAVVGEDGDPHPDLTGQRNIGVGLEHPSPHT